MKVTLITATYNSSKTIRDCIQSVIEQTYSNIEYLIIDGKSTDETLTIVQSFAVQHTNIKYVSESDQGIYDALNKGLNRSTGDLVGFVHSDDLLANKDTIKEIVEVFKTRAVDGLYGNLKYVKFNNINKVIRYWVSQPFSRTLLRKGWMPAHPTLYLKKEVYQKQGGFNTEFKIAADYDLILRIFSTVDYRFHFLPSVIYIMRVGGASNKSLKNIITKSKEDVRALKNNNYQGVFWIVLKKNISKVPQWFRKKIN